MKDTIKYYIIGVADPSISRKKFYYHWGQTWHEEKKDGTAFKSKSEAEGSFKAIQLNEPQIRKEVIKYAPFADIKIVDEKGLEVEHHLERLAGWKQRTKF